jgi:hypothetical protein
MNITFSAIGLDFEADVSFTPGIPGTYWDPPEEDEFEIGSLTCDGVNVEFLLDSQVGDTIFSAAWDAAERQDQALVRENKADRACDRWMVEQEA